MKTRKMQFASVSVELCSPACLISRPFSEQKTGYERGARGTMGEEKNRKRSAFAIPVMIPILIKVFDL